MADWKSIVKTVAPALGTALGGPVSGMAIKALSDAFLGDVSDASRSDVEHQLERYVENAGPNELIKIKELDQSFKATMRKLDIDVYKLENQDRESARDTHKDSYMPSAIYWSSCFMVAGGAYALMAFEIPPENSSILYMLFGQVLTAWVSATAYFVGTTRSSGTKTKMISSRASSS